MMTPQPAQGSAPGAGGHAATIPGLVAAVHAAEADLTAAIKHLDRRYGMRQERQVVGVETERAQLPRPERLDHLQAGRWRAPIWSTRGVDDDGG